VARNRFTKLGGGIIFLLLPCLAFSNSVKGLSLAYSASDNLYLLATKEYGSLLALYPFLNYSQSFDVEFKGKYSIINFNTNNLFLENKISLQKHLYLHGAGNNNCTYIQFYNLFTPSFDLYRYTTVSAGDSVNLYLLNRFLCSPDFGIRYRYFAADSIPGYLEPYLKSSLSIPLPYFFLIPGAELGSKIYENETLPFYRIFSRFDSPLSMSLSLKASIEYYHYAFSDGTPPVSLSYNDEPFFEEESVNEQTSLIVSMKKLFQREKISMDIQCDVFKKQYFPIEGVPRSDSGTSLYLLLTKMLGPISSISVSFKSLLNYSTIDDFDYSKNSIEIQYNLLY